MEKFIINAKANGWVGAQPAGKKISSSRKGSFDITYEEGDFFYQDSFVGLTDFCGQEHVCFKNEPVWSMAYFGYVVQQGLFTSKQTVEVLRSALGALYREGRFLGEFRHHHEKCEYHDVNHGDFRNFHGKESIHQDGVLVFELRYFGGLVRR